MSSSSHQMSSYYDDTTHTTLESGSGAQSMSINSSSTEAEGKGLSQDENYYLDVIRDRLDELDRKSVQSLLSVLTVGRATFGTSYVFNMLFGLPVFDPLDCDNVEKVADLDLSTTRRWINIKSRVCPGRNATILWAHCPGAVPPVAPKGSKVSTELHHARYDFNRAVLSAFFDQRKVDLCMCVVDITETDSAKANTPVFEIPYAYCARQFLRSGVVVGSNAEQFMTKAFECRTADCKCREYKSATPSNITARTSGKAPLCASCGHKEKAHRLGTRSQLKKREAVQLNGIRASMDRVFRGRTVPSIKTNVVSKVLKNVLDLHKEYSTKQVPVLQSSYEDLLPDNETFWLSDLWFKVFMRLQDDALYMFYIATEHQCQLPKRRLRAVLRRVEEAIERAPERRP